MMTASETQALLGHMKNEFLDLINRLKSKSHNEPKSK